MNIIPNFFQFSVNPSFFLPKLYPFINFLSHTNAPQKPWKGFYIHLPQPISSLRLLSLDWRVLTHQNSVFSLFHGPISSGSAQFRAKMRTHLSYDILLRQSLTICCLSLLLEMNHWVSRYPVLLLSSRSLRVLLNRKRFLISAKETVFYLIYLLFESGFVELCGFVVY